MSRSGMLLDFGRLPASRGRMCDLTRRIHGVNAPHLGRRSGAHSQGRMSLEILTSCHFSVTSHSCSRRAYVTLGTSVSQVDLALCESSSRNYRLVSLVDKRGTEDERLHSRNVYSHAAYCNAM